MRHPSDVQKTQSDNVKLQLPILYLPLHVNSRVLSHEERAEAVYSATGWEDEVFQKEDKPSMEKDPWLPDSLDPVWETELKR